MTLQDKVILELVNDAKQSDSKLAKKLGCAQSTIFRVRKQLEKEGKIWGYSAVVDWTKLGYSMYVITIRTKPATKDGARKVLEGLRSDNPNKFGVQLLDMKMLFGEFEWCLLIASPTEKGAHNYINFIRQEYGNFFEHRPKHAKAIFTCKQQGQTNPNINNLEQLGI